MEIGVIFHWGLYSVPAYDDVSSARKRRIQNGSEWYAKRLTEKGTFRPISGWKETQEYHKKNYSKMGYKDFKGIFEENSKEWNPDEWMKLCKKLGATYVILTTRHHDGYCLWPTRTTSFGTDKLNYVDMFCKSARKYELKVGFYYSWLEFEQGFTKDYINTIVRPQIDELLEYRPDIWWFDGDWICSTKYAQDFIDECCDKIHKKTPLTIINDRVGRKEQKIDINFLGKSDYRVYADRYIPVENPAVKWEHINTIGLSWGRNKDQKDIDYKQTFELFVLYCQVKAKGGNFLLNIGPDSNGSICQEEISRIKKLSGLVNL